MTEPRAPYSGDGRDDERVPIRSDLAEVVPYGAPQLDVEVRLNTNETAEPPPHEFLTAFAAGLDDLDLHRYPDRDARDLRGAIAARHGRDVAEVWPANGSNEVLLQLLLTYGGPGRSVLSTQPCYSMYPELCRDAFTSLVTVDLDDRLEIEQTAVVDAVDRHCPSVVLLASPHNPVGGLVSHDTVRALHEAGDGLVIIDEAYIEFGPDGASVLRLLDELPRLVVVRTFSKAYRLAGLRLGYLVARQWVVDDVQKVRLPYHLDAVKQRAGMIALERETAFLAHRRRVVAERERLTTQLRKLPGVEVFDSAANFVLVRSTVNRLFERLLEHDILVRDFSDKPRLAGCVRITVGTHDENTRLLTAFADIVAARS